MVQLLSKSWEIAPSTNWPTPLFAAAANGHSKVGRTLLQNSTDLNIGSRCTRLLHENFKRIHMINHDEMFDVDDHGQYLSPLYAAIYNKHIEIVAMLLRKGVSIDKWSEQGITASDESFWDGTHNVQSLITMIYEIFTTDFISVIDDTASDRHGIGQESLKYIYRSLLIAAAPRGSETGL